MTYLHLPGMTLWAIPRFRRHESPTQTLSQLSLISAKTDKNAPKNMLPPGFEPQPANQTNSLSPPANVL